MGVNKMEKHEGVERFAISVEKDLLNAFERLRKRIGYRSRSEAIKDLMRDFLVREKWRAGNKHVTGVISVVYNHEKRALPEKLIDLQHRRLANIISTMHIHVDEDNCCEVIALKGMGKSIKKIADEIRSLKSVKHVRLLMTGNED